MPGAQIVYDRYHMQAQYGKEVLGVVRLEEARKHKAQSAQMAAYLKSASAEKRKDLQAKIRNEKHRYNVMKNFAIRF